MNLLGFSKEQVQSQLKDSYDAYYKIKTDHIAKRLTYLEELANALAENNEMDKAMALRQLREREHQRSVARKIRYLQGKLSKSSTTMVTVESPEGGLKDITDKIEMEGAIMESNAAKFRQSHHRPLFHDPLKRDFGFKGLTPQAKQVLSGVYESKEAIPTAERQLLNALSKPNSVRTSGSQTMDISLHSYRSFWRKAKETTSSYSAAISYSTMKAGSTSSLISSIECN
jgi:hypothetical protein